MHHVACLMVSLVNSGKFACVKLVWKCKLVEKKGEGILHSTVT